MSSINVSSADGMGYRLDAPEEECDIVMKGGVASGIVYPPVIVELHRKYRFRNIGGTSAGAIAAGIAAAAEYGRATGGFEKLKNASDQIGSPGFLRHLFEPSSSTRTLLLMAETMLKPMTWETRVSQWRASPLKTPVQILLTVLKFFGASLLNIPLLFLSGLLFGAVSGWAGKQVILRGCHLAGYHIHADHPTWPILALILVCSAACVVFWTLAFSVAYLALVFFKRLPTNNFGVCKGHNPQNAEGDPLLTDWLHQTVNHIAQIPVTKPLTFGQLRHYRDNIKPDDGIDLKMVTSNLSQQLPYVLPFEDAHFMFREDEMRDMFPAKVVDYMKDKGEELKTKYATVNEEWNAVTLPEGYYFLPEGDDLPVVVGMRMSLALPIVISATPLYAVSADVTFLHDSPTPLQAHDLQKQWFSDGGTASNFPIQFFDTWLPTRPTFGVNLTYPKTNSKASANGVAQTNRGAKNDGMQTNTSSPARTEEVKACLTRTSLSYQRDDSQRKSQQFAENNAVYLPSPGENRVTSPEWSSLSGVPGFLGGIFYTAKDYRDTLQSTLPSYRDRIVQIRFTPEQGGINLSMPPRVVKDIMRNGTVAGAKLRDDFSFEKHQWIRFLVLMRRLEQEAQTMQRTLQEGNFNLNDILAAMQVSANDFPFTRKEAWISQARVSMQNLQTLIDAWEKQTIFAEDPPVPEPVLRITPEI